MPGTVEGRRTRMLPAGPLLEAVERLRGGRSMEQLAADCGVTSRRFRDWRAGCDVEPETADKVMCRLGLLWWEVFDEDRFPEAHARAAELFG